MRRLLLSLALIAVASRCDAINLGFLPGDAFFHSILTEKRCEELRSGKASTIPYVRPESEKFGFCGYAGYWNLQFGDDDQPLIENLSALYRHLRTIHPREVREYTDSEGKTEQFETNGFHIFIYNQEADLTSKHIGLRYNEAWVEDESSFGPQPSTTRLEMFINDPKAFSDDWRDAESVAPLKTICPPIPNQEKRKERGTGNAEVEIPVQLAAQVKIIVLPSSQLKQYFHRKNGTTFFEVTLGGIKAYRAKKGLWEEFEWDEEARD